MTNHDTQLIYKDGKPEWAVIPYDEYQQLVAQAEQNQATQEQASAPSTEAITKLQRLIGPEVSAKQLAELSATTIALLNSAVLTPTEAISMAELTQVVTVDRFEAVIDYLIQKENTATNAPLVPMLNCFFSTELNPEGTRYHIYDLPTMADSMAEVVFFEDKPADDEPDMSAWSLGL